MRSSVLFKLQDLRSHSPSRPAVATPLQRRAACSARSSSCAVSRSTSSLSAKYRSNDISLKDISSRLTSTVVCASKKDSPDSEELLKAGLEIAKTVAASDPKIQAISAFAGKYLGTDTAGSSNAASSGAFSAPTKSSPYRRVSLLALLLVNIATFVLANDIAPQFFSSLPLNHARPGWWQFVTSSFCSASWQQLSGLSFVAVAFGAQVAARKGATGVWFTYVLGAAGTNLAWYWLLPERVGRTVLMTSSSLYGAFALFLAGAFLQVGSFWWWLLEFALLGQFLLWLLLKDATLAALPAATISGVKVAGALVGLAGCVAGVGVYFLLAHWFEKFAQWAKKHSK